MAPKKSTGASASKAVKAKAAGGVKASKTASAVKKVTAAVSAPKKPAAPVAKQKVTSAKPVLKAAGKPSAVTSAHPARRAEDHHALHYDKEALLEDYSSVFNWMMRIVVAVVTVASLYFFIFATYLGGVAHTPYKDFVHQFGDRIQLEYDGDHVPAADLEQGHSDVPAMFVKGASASAVATVAAVSETAAAPATVALEKTVEVKKHKVRPVKAVAEDVEADSAEDVSEAAGSADEAEASSDAEPSE